MWLTADYLATTLFSLKPAWATTSGGRTLLLPTPFAIKMALLDVVCRTEGVEYAESLWPDLRDLPVALRPARQVIVNNTFTKIWKPWEFKGKKDERPAAVAKAKEKRKYPMQDTIGYREYAYLDGTLGIALGLLDDAWADRLVDWLMGINYLGKRGGFVQLAGIPQLADDLPAGFLPIDGQLPEQMPVPGLMQQLDECGESLTFEKANIYSGKRITKDVDRVLLQVVLPYELVSSSRGYTWYALTESTDL